MKKDLLKIIDNLSGKVFTLGIVDKDLVSALQKNRNITEYLMLNINEDVEYEKSEKTKEVKNLNISKIKKKNKKKNIDYSICEISDSKEHLGTLINDTIYFTKNIIYYYGKQDEIDLDMLIKKYRRYKVIIENNKYSDGSFILKIDVKNAKTNKFKGFLYKIVDIFELLFECLTNFLVS